MRTVSISTTKRLDNSALLPKCISQPTVSRSGLARSYLFTILLATGSSVGVQAQAARNPSQNPEGTGPADRIRSEFQAICQQSRERDNPFYSDRTLHALEQRAERPFANPIREAETRGLLAWEYLRTGEFDKALNEAQTALGRLAEHDVRTPGLWGYLKEIEGTSHLQAAEAKNCLQLHNHASCLLPLESDGVHQEPASAKAAKASFLELLERNPNRVSARWLANLTTLLAGEDLASIPEEFRLPDEAFQGTSTPLSPWTDLGPRVLSQTATLAGAAITDDFDGDGLLDLISSSMDPCEPLQALRNTGDGKFSDVTESWGLDSQLGGLNVIHADFDDDGHLDLLVLRGAWFGKEGRTRNSLLRNALHEGKGFIDITIAAGIAYPAFPTQSAAVADFDGDGDLDLAIANEAKDIVIDPSKASNAVTSGHPFQLFLNLLREDQAGDPLSPLPAALGEGTKPLRFRNITRQAGIGDYSFGKAVTWGDIDNDGDPDLYLSNFGPNRLFRNDSQKEPRFTEITTPAGVSGADRRTFASWFFDFDQDGDQDLFVASYNVPADVVAGKMLGLTMTTSARMMRPDRVRSHPMLFRNDGFDSEGITHFTDISSHVGLDQPILAMGANFGDIDSDGFPDVYLGTGMPDFSALHPNILLRNDGGKRFQDLTFDLGMAHLQKGHGVAFADLDHDGDLDLFHELGGAFPYDGFPNALFINPIAQSVNPPSWIVVSLEGNRDNRFGVGARIAVSVSGPGGPRTVHATVGAGGSFGESSLRAHLGLGHASKIEKMTIRWPSGLEETLSVPEINRYYSVLQGAGKVRLLKVPKLPWRPSGTHPPAG